MITESTLDIEEKPGFPWETPKWPASSVVIAKERTVAPAMHAHKLDTKRFTLNGSAELERHLETVCSRVGAEIRRLIPETKLEGLLLAGGYGRGEGGVLQTEAGNRPYNDLEFYVFVRGQRILAQRKYETALIRLGQCLSPDAGVEIEFKVLTLDQLKKAPPSMFYYDLVIGHRWIIGEDSLLAGCEHHRAARDIPKHEATRLLMNRCSGLLFAAERLQRKYFGPKDSDFVQRNLAKAQLALGDTLLAASGDYHWSCQERLTRLVRLKIVSREISRDAICRHHAAGVIFKLLPVRSTASRETLARQHAELCQLARVVWFHHERQRLCKAFASPLEYILSGGNKCPETKPWRNCLINARTFGLSAVFHKNRLHYPRQRLFHALNVLLWEKNPTENPMLLRIVQRELNTRAADFAGLVGAYEKLWHRFN